jgi:hypothetical protein
MEVNKLPYDEAFAYAQEYLKGDDEQPLIIKISIRDWNKLFFDLGLNSITTTDCKTCLVFFAVKIFC